MRQGKQRVISYKVHKRAPVPENEWFVVENAIPPIIDSAHAIGDKPCKYIPYCLSRVLIDHEGVFVRWRTLSSSAGSS
mgnify:CR=1 FL=1